MVIVILLFEFLMTTISIDAIVCLSTGLIIGYGTTPGWADHYAHIWDTLMLCRWPVTVPLSCFLSHSYYCVKWSSSSSLVRNFICPIWQPTYSCRMSTQVEYSRSHTFMMTCKMMFYMVISYFDSVSWLPYDLKLSFYFSVSNPVVPYIHCLGQFMFYYFVGYSFYYFICVCDIFSTLVSGIYFVTYIILHFWS